MKAFLWGLFQYILLMTAPSWYRIMSGIFIVGALVWGTYEAFKGKEYYLIVLYPLFVWLAMLFFFFMYDKLNIIFIPF